MRRAYIINLIMLTLISAVSCSTVSPADSSPQEPAAHEAQDEAQDEAQNEAQDEAASEAAQPASSSDTAHSEPAAKEPQAEAKSESNPEPDSDSESTDTAPAIQHTISEPIETVVADTSPEATLPDSHPRGQQEKARFLMLSPQIEVSAVLPESDSPAARVSAPSEERPAQASAERMTAAEPEGGEDSSAKDRSDQVSRTQPPPPESEPQPEPAQPDIETIRAGKGEQVHLSLPGFGWIYDRGGSQSSGVEFRSRSYAQSATEFVFTARDIGRYTLAFQQQDSSTGRSSVKRIAVEVSLQTVQDRIAAQAAGAAEGQSAESADTGNAASPGDGRSPDLQLPSFSFERLESAVLARNTNSIAQQVQGLLLSRGADGNSDLQPAVAGEAAFTDAQRKLLVEAGKLLADSEREMLAEQVLKLYLQESGEQIGRVLYLLGRIYESPPPPRDERRSVEYYQRIVNFYPTDPYRRRAEERIKYLQRHFLQIR